MRLEDWLAANRVTQEDFASKVGVRQGTIARLLWHDGRPPLRQPSLKLIARVAKATGGLVTASDFAEVAGRIANATGGSAAANDTTDEQRDADASRTERTETYVTRRRGKLTEPESDSVTAAPPHGR